MSSYGKILRLLRERKNESLEQVARNNGITMYKICALESDRTAGIKILEKMSEYYGIEYKSLKSLELRARMEHLTDDELLQAIEECYKKNEIEQIETRLDGLVLKCMRVVSNLNTREAGEMLGLTGKYVEYAEKSKERVSLEVIKKFSKIYNFDVEDVIRIINKANIKKLTYVEILKICVDIAVKQLDREAELVK